MATKDEIQEGLARALWMERYANLLKAGLTWEDSYYPGQKKHARIEAAAAFTYLDSMGVAIKVDRARLRAPDNTVVGDGALVFEGVDTAWEPLVEPRRKE